MSEVLDRSMLRVLFVAVAVSASFAGCAQEAPEDDSATSLALTQGPLIDKVSVSGPGCARFRGASIAISGSRDTFRIRFDELKVASEGISRSSKCQVSVLLEGEDGVQYAPAGLQIEVESARGRAFVTPTAAWTHDPSRTASSTTSFTQGRFVTGGLDHGTLWSSCSGDRELRFDLELALEEGSEGAASVNRIRNLSFYSRSCSNNAPDAQIDAAVLDAQTGDDPDAKAPGSADAGTSTDAEANPPDADAQTTTPSEPDAPTAVVRDVSFSGGGCPVGSATAFIAPAGNSFEASFTKLISEGTADRRLRTAYCSVIVQADAPPGSTLAVESFTLSGSADLPEGWTTRTDTFYSWQGQSGGSTDSKLVNQAGPREGPFEAEIRFVGDELKFRNCAENRPLTIDLTNTLRGTGTSAAARAELTRVSNVRFVTRPCGN